MTTLLIRHAESAAQTGVASSDAALIPLSEKGREKATQFASQLMKSDLIVVSPFIRTRQTAQPLIDLYPEVPVEEWAVQEFTYLAPKRCRDMTAGQRDPMVREYWERQDPAYVDGTGAESFNQFIRRAGELIWRCRELDIRTYIFSHTMFMQAVRLSLESSGEIIDMTAFRDACFIQPIRNLEALVIPRPKKTIWQGGLIRIPKPSKQKGEMLNGPGSTCAKGIYPTDLNKAD